ncbi:MAG: beta-lactamase family protein [Sphingobium sp.]|nr:beta-lactamase family protein [Sphingobium sp.]
MKALTTNRRDMLAGATMAVLAGGPALSATRRANAPAVKGGKKADALCKAVFAESKAPAFTVAVARTSGPVWSAAYGRANVELAVDATTAHSFRLGSVSKVLTSTLAARLVSRGLLDLDTRIAKWLPDLPAHHRQTTLRQLLTHRGGVRHYTPRDFDITGPGGAVYGRLYRTNQDVLDLFINDPLIAPPGSRVSYSSYGFTLASLVMEKAADRPFVSMIKEEIGQPFGLGSLIEDEPTALIAARATGYMNEMDLTVLYGQLPAEVRPKLTNGVGNMPWSNPAYCWAGAGFLLTTPDAARFGAALLDSPNARISAAERSLLFTPMTQADKNSPPLGLAWRVDADVKNRQRWHHAGATPGGRYGLIVYPEQGLSVAMASNVMSAPGNVLKYASDLVDVFAA